MEKLPDGTVPAIIGLGKEFLDGKNTIELTKPVRRADHIRFRNEKIMELKRKLNRCHRRYLLVNGFGGVGKTTLVKRLYHQLYEENQFRYMAWLNYQGNLSNSINLAFNSPIEGEEKRVGKFLKKLNSEPRKRKLLVIDDVENPADDALLREISGIKNLSIILTGRMENLEGYDAVTVPLLTETECVALFREFYGKDATEDTVLNLVRLVQCHTLAVEILAKTAYRRRKPLEVFLSELQKKGLSHSTLKAETSYRDGSRTMAAYLRELFPMEEREKAEIPVLQNVALMPSMEIPVEVTDWISCEQATLEQLVKSGWLEFHEKTDDHPAGYYMHPLVKETVLLDREKFPESIGGGFVDCLRKHTYFEENETYVTVFPKLEIADSVLKGMGERETVEYATACDNLGHYYWVFGLYDRAEEYFLKGRDVCETVLGTDHPDTAAVYNDLGCLYQEQEVYGQAEEYYLKSLAVRKKVLGAEHRDTAITRISLAWICSFDKFADESWRRRVACGDIEKYLLGLKKLCLEIEKFLLELCPVAEERQGMEHPFTAAIYHSIGILRHTQERYDEAMEKFLRAFRVWRKVFGETHPYYKEESNWISKTYPKTSYGKNQPFEIWFASVTKEEIT